MKISIIIPVYNVELYINDCLKSVFAQSYKDLEIIIVNDKTQDRSMEIIEDLVSKKKDLYEIKIINHTKNRGLSVARNTGIKESTGDYLFFLDSDDEITPECIDLLVSCLNNRSLDIVVGDYVTIGDRSLPSLQFSNSVIYGNKKIRELYMKERIYGMAWNKLINKAFLLKNKLYFTEGLIHEDCLWSFQLACHVQSIGFVKHHTYTYKLRQSSIITSLSIEKELFASKQVIKGMIDYAGKYGLLNDKYVHSFIEEEKLRLLNTLTSTECVDIEEPKSLYMFYRNLYMPNLTRLFVWNFFKSRKCIRDAHYFLPFSLGTEYYLKLPNYLNLRSLKNNKIRFYLWFLKIVIVRVLGLQKLLKTELISM